ncbi:MAG: fumarylacetoacetate hydrolase family protein [Actinobacteria bacterium]|nr:fumarylacetoacetate hydrolase family protein [Actinomycetota bacterium]
MSAGPLRLFRFGPPGEERPGAEWRRERLDVSGFGEDYDEGFFAREGVAGLRRRLEATGAALPRVPTGVRLGPPICRPSKIICVGLNYRDHARETGAAVPAEPVLFCKATTAISGPFDPLVLPREATKVDWEVELGVVVGRRARYVAPGEAAGHIAGYLLHNDYSERAFQLERGGQWVKGKSCDTFAPLGPWLVPADDVADPSALAMWLSVNGELRQRGTTADMVFGPAFLVAYISRFMTLLPGDLISTGTPAGVGLGMSPPVYLQAGDVIECGIEGLGEMRQVAVEEEAP